jgi:hypothetical protein
METRCVSPVLNMKLPESQSFHACTATGCRTCCQQRGGASRMWAVLLHVKQLAGDRGKDHNDHR